MPNTDTVKKSTKDIETKVGPPFGQRSSHDHSCEQVLVNVCSCYRVHTFQGSNGWRGVERQMLFHSPSVLVPSHSVTQGLNTPLCPPADHTCSPGSPLYPRISPRKSDLFGTIAVFASICKHPQLLFKTLNIHSSI